MTSEDWTTLQALLAPWQQWRICWNRKSHEGCYRIHIHAYQYLAVYGLQKEDRKDTATANYMSSSGGYSIYCKLLIIYIRYGEHNHKMGNPMDGTPPQSKTDSAHLIEDNLVRYCLKTFETATRQKERWCCRETNPGPLAYAASALPLSHNTHRQPPLFFPL